MGSCSGKVLEKEYAGYNVPPGNNKKEKTAIQGKGASPKVENNKHGIIVAPHKVQELKSRELSSLLKLLNHESADIANITYEIINGISVNEFTGTLAVVPKAIASLSNLLESACGSVLINCIAALHTLVQQDEDLTVAIYISCVGKLISLMQREIGDLLCGAISLLGLMAAVDDILCDMIDKDIHEMLADKFHSTSDVVVKRQIFLTLHNFMTIKNSEKAMHTKVIKILVDTLQIEDDVIDPDIRCSALRILSYIAMSGTECLRKMIGEFGGISTLAKIAQIPAPIQKGFVSLDIVKIAGIALSGLCCVEDLQVHIFQEWGLESILQFLESFTKTTETDAILAVVMGVNYLLDNNDISETLRSSAALKQCLRAVQQKCSNEDLLEECTETLSKLLANKDQTRLQTKFDNLCKQHFSPYAPMMLRKQLLIESIVQATPKASPLRTWLVSPEHAISHTPRRLLFPRKLNLFYLKTPSPPSHPPYTSTLNATTPKLHTIMSPNAQPVFPSSASSSCAAPIGSVETLLTGEE